MNEPYVPVLRGFPLFSASLCARNEAVIREAAVVVCISKLIMSKQPITPGRGHRPIPTDLNNICEALSLAASDLSLPRCLGTCLCFDFKTT